MNKKELIEKIKKLPFVLLSERYISQNYVLELLEQLDEPETGHADEAPRYVKNILARLRELPEHDREVWLKAIMGEFERDFSRAKWREGYEQGKVEGMFEREKVTIPQSVVDWIEHFKKCSGTLYGSTAPYSYYGRAITDDFEGDVTEVLRWIRDNSEVYARAWLDGYEVEKEPKYTVRVKGVNEECEYLFFGELSNTWKFRSLGSFGELKKHHTRKELEEAGFGWVFDCPVLTPDQAEKRQNGRRFKTDGEPMFTLTAQDRHGVVVGNEIKKFGTIEPNFNQSGVVYETDGIAPTIRAYQGGGLEPKIIQRAHGYNQGGEHDIAPTLTSNSYHENNVLKITEATSQGYAEAEIGDSINLSHPNSKTRQGRVGKQIANTLLTGESQGVVEPDYRIRKLTPRECWRLQGFPDWAFDKAQEVNSNSQLYKQAGNSVTVNVIAAIAKELL